MAGAALRKRLVLDPDHDLDHSNPTTTMRTRCWFRKNRLLPLGLVQIAASLEGPGVHRAPAYEDRDELQGIIVNI